MAPKAAHRDSVFRRGGHEKPPTVEEVLVPPVALTTASQPVCVRTVPTAVESVPVPAPVVEAAPALEAVPVPRPLGRPRLRLVTSTPTAEADPEPAQEVHGFGGPESCRCRACVMARHPAAMPPRLKLVK